MAIEIVDFPIKKWWIFPCKMLVHQMVAGWFQVNGTLNFQGDVVTHHLQGTWNSFD